MRKISKKVYFIIIAIIILLAGAAVGIFRASSDERKTSEVAASEGSEETSDAYAINKTFSADVTHDGKAETIVVKQEYLEMSQTPGMGTVDILSQDAEGNEKKIFDWYISQTESTYLYLTEIDGEYYFLQYFPTQFSRSCTYSYEIFSLSQEGEKIPYKIVEAGRWYTDNLSDAEKEELQRKAESLEQAMRNELHNAVTLVEFGPKLSSVCTLSGDATTDKSVYKYKENMLVYDLESGLVSENIIAALPEHRSELFYLKHAETELFIYCNDSEIYRYDSNRAYIHLFVNETEYVLDNLEKSFYLRAIAPPQVLWYDFNKDGVEDFIFQSYFDRYGFLQYLFLSTADGEYENVGSVTWNRNDGEETGLTYEEFPYKVTLLDGFKIQISMAVAGINETYELEEHFVEEYAIPLKMYDESGTVTEIGKNWDFYSIGLYDCGLEGEVNEAGDFILRTRYHVGVGYGSLSLDCGFEFQWKVAENGYELLGITPFLDKR